MGDRNGNGDRNGLSEIPGAPQGSGKRPFGVVVASAVGGFRVLVRQHVELAKLESIEAASARGFGVGMMAAAAAMAFFAVGFGAAAAAAGLAILLPTWAAILIVAGVFVLAAGVLMLVGRGTMRTAPKVERTRETLKEDARWARQQIAR